MQLRIMFPSIKYLTKTFLFLFITIHLCDPIMGNPTPIYNTMGMEHNSKISPEIVNELKDFKNLISPAKIDAIVAEHFLVDGNFRKAFKFVSSSEFNHMLSQLVDMPEIVQVLDFLHLIVNATEEENAKASAAIDESSLSSSSPVVNGNEMKKVTTTAETTGTKDFQNGGMVSSIADVSAIELAARNALVYKTQQLEELENSIDMNIAFPMVDIVQLENEGNEHVADDGEEEEELKQEYNYEDDDDFRLMLHHMQHPVGTFTSFIEEVMGELPHAAYQNMIIEKCKKNANFAEFYKALRSPALKPLVDQVMKTPNIIKFISTLNNNDVDVKALEPLAFQVISWGPSLDDI